MKPIKEKYVNQREDELRRKWGSCSPSMNEELDKTNRMILNMVKGITDRMPEAIKKHINTKIEFENRWANGEFNTWRDFYDKNEPKKER